MSYVMNKGLGAAYEIDLGFPIGKKVVDVPTDQIGRDVAKSAIQEFQTAGPALLSQLLSGQAVPGAIDVAWPQTKMKLEEKAMDFFDSAWPKIQKKIEDAPPDVPIPDNVKNAAIVGGIAFAGLILATAYWVKRGK